MLDTETKKIAFDSSLQLLNRAKKVIPGCSQTFSKSRHLFSEGAAPLFAERAEGVRLWDADGNEYIDYSLALGPMILGYSHPKVNRAVQHQLVSGSAFSLPHRLEISVAEQLVDIIPCAEMVRFGKNGSDATSAAVRIARAATGREMIACCGYHGWQDWFIGTTSRDLGVPKAVKQLTKTFAYNKIETLEAVFSENPGQIAAVIMEPIGIQQPEKGFLESVQELCRKNGSVLIFDEMVTGFRISLGGAQEVFGVTPDMACFGKAMANGFPISAVVGRKNLMAYFDQIFYSTTFGGDTISLAACSATLEILQNEPVFAHIEKIGRRLIDGINSISRRLGTFDLTQAVGWPAHHLVTFNNQDGSENLSAKTLFQQECVKRGILFPGYHNICYMHAESDADKTLAAYEEALTIVRDAIKENRIASLLEGKLLQPVFRKL